MSVCEGCGKELRKGWQRFCSFACSSAWSERRGKAFAEATSRAPGKPQDGVTYGASGSRGKGK